MSDGITRVEFGKDNGTEYEHESGRTSFQSQDEALSAMRDPRYATDKGYRDFVIGMLKNSGTLGLGSPDTTTPDQDELQSAIDYPAITTPHTALNRKTSVSILSQSILVNDRYGLRIP
jgi:hypothetical protein